MAHHTVRPGDTVSSIAAEHYGTPAAADRVLVHNQGRIRGGTVLPGTILHLPASLKD